MKIVLLPLDERPCNLNYPSLMPLGEEIKIVTPKRNLLSKKKERCVLELLHIWLLEKCKDADYAIISMDTLLYGGIVPSRLHHDSLETLINRSSFLKQIKDSNPNIKIYVNELIMRTPCYSLSDEEPDYFDICGRELWQYGVYLDKKEQGLISKEELDAFNELDASINHEYLDDLMNRRNINKKAILHTIDLYKEGVIDYLVIPQDDCHPYGFTSRDRRDVLSYIESVNLNKELLMYPGADEVGLTLLSRVLNDFYKTSLKTYVIYASEIGRKAIPSFEDRGVEETISYHLKACGLTYTENYDEAELVLFVNNGDEFFDGNLAELPNFNFNRDLTDFVNKMKTAILDNKIVGIADNIFCNMGDELLFKTLFENELIDSIHSYAGWNTSSNTLDTTVCGMVSYYFSKDVEKKNLLLLYRYVEDFFYMGYVRSEVVNKITANPQWNIKINALGAMKQPLEQYTKERLERLFYKYQLNSLYWAKNLQVDFIWNRTFEIELIIK